MLNLFDNFDQASFDFLRSQRAANIKIPTVVINDDGFLPPDVESPIKFWGQYNQKRVPLYFDHLPLPRYWRILSDASKGQVYELDQKRADILYQAGDNSRQVKAVRWLDGQGKVSWVDHYNRYGYCFAKTYYYNGQPAWRKYYDKNSHLFLEWNLRSGDIFLKAEHGRHFSSLTEFIRYYLQTRHFKLDHVFYNTLNQGLSVSLGLPATGEDTLFWHEQLTGDELPGNMQFLMGKQTRTRHIIFQRYRDWERVRTSLKKVKSNVDFEYLGLIYPHPRPNQLRPQALILTNSDEIVGLKELVEHLPNINFHIAAVTAMSEKLQSYLRYPNVHLYPNVRTTRVKRLIADCDIYLDINRQNEILDAVRGAFEQNMLIVGFDETLHESQFIAPENVFKVTELEAMRKRLLTALLKPAVMKKLIDRQRQMASEVSVEDYQQKIGGVIND